MRIHGDAGDPGFPMPVVVRHRLDADDYCTLGVQFLDSKLLEKHLPAAVFATFNRRNSFRVRPAFDVSTFVAIDTTDGQVIEFVLSDVSAGGCGGIAAADAVDKLSTDDNVVAKFSLPGVARNFELRSSVRCCLSIEQGTRIGLQFDEGARNFPAQESFPMDYIMIRQHAQMQLAS